MKYMPGFTDFFMSPVTGRILLSGFPDLTQNYTWIGGIDDRPVASPIIIDLRLEIIDLRNRLSKTRFILQTASPHFDSSQALDELIPGMLRHDNGVVSIATLSPGNLWIGDDFGYPEETVILPLANMANLPTGYIWIGDGSNRPVPSTTIPSGALPALPYHQIWLGNEDDVATPVDRIWDDGVGHGNLPAYTSDEFKKIWRMDEDGVPILSDALTGVEVQLEITVELTAELQVQIDLALELIAEINLEITAILEAIVTINADIVAINEAIVIINTDIISINEAIVLINADIIAINTAIGIINANIVSIFASIAVIDIHLGDIDLGMADLQGQIDAGIESGLGHLADLQGQIDAGIESGMEHLADINAQFDAINIQIADINTAISDIITSISDIVTSIGDGIVTLTGDVTGSGNVGTPFATTITTTLDQIPLALGDISANINKITDVVDPVDPQDAATKNYVDDLVGDGTIELTGNVLGSGVVGTPFNTDLNSNILTTTGDQTFSYPIAASSTAFALINTFTPTLLTPSNMELTLENSIGSGFQFNLSSGIAGGTFPDGVFQFYAFTSGGSTLIYQATSDLVTFNIPVTMTTDMSMAANYITNVLDPVNPQDAATKNYVDGQTITLIGDVTGSNTIGSSIDTTLATTIIRTGGYQRFDSTSGNQTSTFDLQNNFIPTLGNPSYNSLRFINANGYTYQFYHETDTLDAQGTLFLTSSTSTILAINNTGMQLNGALDMYVHQIHNVVDPTSDQDAATKYYVDGRTITLTGDVTGTNTLGSSIATTLAVSIPRATNIQTFSFDASLEDTFFEIKNNYVESGGSPSINNLTFTNRSVKQYSITHYTDTGALGTQGALYIQNTNVGDLWYIDSVENGVLVPLNMNSHKINNVTDPTSAQDAATKNYVDGRTITLTGDVTGTNTLGSSIATTLATTIIRTGGYQRFDSTSGNQTSTFDIQNNFVPTLGNPSYNNLRFINANGYTYQFYHATDTLDAQGTFYLTSSTSTILEITNAGVQLNGALDMFVHQINNVVDPTSAQDAATKYYVDGRTITLTGDVTGSNTLGSSIATTLATSISRATNIQTFSFASGNQDTYFEVKNNYVETSGHPSISSITFTNRSSKQYSMTHYTDTGALGTQGALYIQNTNAGNLWTLNSTENGLFIPLNMNSHKITSLATPTTSTDATTKAYVDGRTITLTGDVTGSNTLGSSIATTLATTISRSGGSQTFTFGTSQNSVIALTNGFTPTVGNPAITYLELNNSGASQKAQILYESASTGVDTFHLDIYHGGSGVKVFDCNQTGFNIFVPLNMNSHKITSVTDPTSAQDAATKNYVDTYKACGTMLDINSATTTSLSAGIWTLLNGLASSNYLNNFTVPSSNKLKYTGTPTVSVLVTANLCLSSNAAGSFYVGLTKNGAAMTSTSSIVGPISTAINAFFFISTNGTFSMATNDYITVWVNASGTATSTNYYCAVSAVTQ